MSDAPTHAPRDSGPHTVDAQPPETPRAAARLGERNTVEIPDDQDRRAVAHASTVEVDQRSFSAELAAYLDAASVEGLGDRLVARLRERDAAPGDSGLSVGGNREDRSEGHRHEVTAVDLDVVWTTHDSVLGPLLLAFRSSAVVRVAFENEDFDTVVDSLGERFGRRTLRAARPADELRRQLDAYLAGERTTFDVPFDLVLSPAPFRREVQQSLPRIPYGTTASYGEVAVSAGRPKAVRAVGSACATNPLPIVLPCHRVLRSDGSLGQYLGGAQTKRFLLDHERNHRPDASRR